MTLTDDVEGVRLQRVQFLVDEMVMRIAIGKQDVADGTDVVNAGSEATQDELLRLQERVLELETELGHRSWKVGDFYRVPTATGAPVVFGQVVTVAHNGRPFQVIEAAEPGLMGSVPSVRALDDGLAPTVVGCDKPDWWPL